MRLSATTWVGAGRRFRLSEGGFEGDAVAEVPRVRARGALGSGRVAVPVVVIGAKVGV